MEVHPKVFLSYGSANSQQVKQNQEASPFALQKMNKGTLFDGAGLTGIAACYCGCTARENLLKEGSKNIKRGVTRGVLKGSLIGLGIATACNVIRDSFAEMGWKW